MNNMTMDCCKRICEITNRPSYIVLFNGDDSNFVGNQSIDIAINTELDLTGCKAHFRFMDFVQDFDEIPADKTLHLVFPHDKTKAFPLGAADASLVLEDSSHRLRTIGNRIHIVVTKSVPEAYANEETQAITVTVTGTVTWDMIQGKPVIPTPQDIPQPSDSVPLMDGEARAGESNKYARGDHRHPSDDSKRGITDMSVRGAPPKVNGVCSGWFMVNGQMVRVSRTGTVWENNTYMISYSSDAEPTPYRITHNVDGTEAWFGLNEENLYTANVDVDTRVTIVGYVGTLARTSSIPTAYANLPEMDGTAYAGNSDKWAKGDHVHPHDTSKRDMTDMSVRGLPVGAEDWFLLGNTKMQYNEYLGGWSGGQWVFYIKRIGDNLYEATDDGMQLETTQFSLDANYMAHITVSTPSGEWSRDFDVVGFADTLATQNWVEDKNYLSAIPNTYKTYSETVSTLSNDGYATTTYAVKNDGGIAKVKSISQSDYDLLQNHDTTTLYVIPEEV